MRTIVVQSYGHFLASGENTPRIPTWIGRCMETTRAWAERQGYAYAFHGDDLFEHVPSTLLQPKPVSVLPLTDLARLALLRSKLSDGYERAVWIDADVAIFRPERFELPRQADALLNHEVWVDRDETGRLYHRRGINNAVMAFRRGHPLLDFLHHAALELFLHLGPSRIQSTTIGTDFLTKLGRLYPVRLCTGCACFSPLLVDAFLQGDRAPLDLHAKHFGQPFHAVNLCLSKRGSDFMDDDADEFDRLLEKLADHVNHAT